MHTSSCLLEMLRTEGDMSQLSLVLFDDQSVASLMYLDQASNSGFLACKSVIFPLPFKQHDSLCIARLEPDRIKK